MTLIDADYRSLLLDRLVKKYKDISAPCPSVLKTLSLIQKLHVLWILINNVKNCQQSTAVDRD